MRYGLAGLCLGFLVAGAARADDYPRTVLRNDRLALTVHLPDARKGFYRGTRFDWSGVVGPVEFAGHKVFGPWKDTHDPANHDDIVGPVEEFGMQAPLGYAEAKEGETFLKIGVGELVKPREEKYRFHHNYAIKYPGAWEVAVRATEIEFKQELLSKSGYGYRYTKRIELADRGNTFTLRHELTNSGTRPIDTDHYNHNFFNVNGDPVGPNYQLTFPFAVTAAAPKDRFAELVKVAGRRVTFAGPLDRGSVHAELTGHAGTREDYKVTFQHVPTGLLLQVEGDAAVEKVNLWGIKTTICPEPFIRIKLKPGESKAWAVTYSFNIAKR